MSELVNGQCLSPAASLAHSPIRSFTHSLIAKMDLYTALALLLVVEVAAVGIDHRHGLARPQFSMPITRAGAPSMPCSLRGSAISVKVGPMRSNAVSIWIIGMPAFSQRL